MKKTVTVVTILCVLFLLISSGFADEFSWDTFDGKWEYITNADVYLMPIRNNEDAWAGYDRAPKRLREPISENWVIETHISNNTEPEGTGSHVGLVVYKDMNNWIMWGQEKNNSTVANGVLGGVGYNIDGIATNYPWLRIAKNGNRYTFSCSLDGVKWLVFPNDYVDTNGFLEGARYGLMGKNWEAFNGGVDTPTYYVEFEYFIEKANNP